jgi:hypothetical protein
MTRKGQEPKPVPSVRLQHLHQLNRVDGGDKPGYDDGAFLLPLREKVPSGARRMRGRANLQVFAPHNQSYIDQCDPSSGPAIALHFAQGRF